MEHFAARQSAADLCKLKGMVDGLAKGRPQVSRLGVGAKIGHFLAQKIDGVRKPASVDMGSGP